MLQEASRTYVKVSTVCVSQRKVIEAELVFAVWWFSKDWCKIQNVLLDFEQRLILDVIYDWTIHVQASKRILRFMGFFWCHRTWKVLLGFVLLVDFLKIGKFEKLEDSFFIKWIILKILVLNTGIKKKCLVWGGEVVLAIMSF